MKLLHKVHVNLNWISSLWLSEQWAEIASRQHPPRAFVLSQIPLIRFCSKSAARRQPRQPGRGWGNHKWDQHASAPTILCSLLRPVPSAWRRISLCKRPDTPPAWMRRDGQGDQETPTWYKLMEGWKIGRFIQPCCLYAIHYWSVRQVHHFNVIYIHMRNLWDIEVIHLWYKR